MRPPSPRRTCSARVGDRPVERLALGAATGSEAALHGSLLRLANPGVPIRGLELTVLPAKTTARIVGVRPVGRARKMHAAFHQPAVGAPVTVVLASLEGETIRPRHGPVLKFEFGRPRRKGRLALGETRLAR